MIPSSKSTPLKDFLLRSLRRTVPPCSRMKACCFAVFGIRPRRRLETNGWILQHITYTPKAPCSCIVGSWASKELPYHNWWALCVFYLPYLGNYMGLDSQNSAPGQRELKSSQTAWE